MEFENLKTRCAHPYCNQIEYLPVKCKYCHKSFCPLHASTKTHECKAVQRDSKLAMECPICLKTIYYKSGDDCNAVMEAHMANKKECDPQNYMKEKARRCKRCPLVKCRKKLTPANSMKCKECGLEFCLEHRWPDSHFCCGKAHKHNHGGGNGSQRGNQASSRQEQGQGRNFFQNIYKAISGFIFLE